MMMNAVFTPPAQHDLQSLMGLVALIADAAGATERTAAFVKASEDLRAATIEAHTAKAELDKAKAAHQTALDKAATQHDAKLAASQAQFEAEWKRRETELATREAAANEMQRKAKAATDEAARIKADYETRLARITAAAASPGV